MSSTALGNEATCGSLVVSDELSINNLKLTGTITAATPTATNVLVVSDDAGNLYQLLLAAIVP